MAQAPRKGSPPPRPPSPLSATAKICSLWRTRTLNTDRRQCCSIYLLKKLVSEKFQLERAATKFSANIIWLLIYLFVEIPNLRGVVNAAASRRPLQGCVKFTFAGRRKHCGVNTAMSTLRCQHCGVNAAAQRRPLRVCGDNLLKLEIFAVLFRSRAELVDSLQF